MTNLQNNWLTEGVFDFEYKKYVLLAYLQDIGRQFTHNRLHPYLPELKLHFDACISIRAAKSDINTSFPKIVKGVNWQTFKLEYEVQHQDDAYMQDLSYLLDFAIPRFSKSISEGTERFSEVEENVKISPVGIVPLRLQEGYLLILHAFQPLVSIFQYQLALYNQTRERLLNTRFLETVRIGIGHSVPQIKMELTRQNRALPNPATYIIESRYEYPLHETLLPVAKKLVLKEINVA